MTIQIPVREPIGSAPAPRPWIQFFRDVVFALAASAADVVTNAASIAALAAPPRASLRIKVAATSVTTEITVGKSSDWASWIENTDYEWTEPATGITYDETAGTFEVESAGTYLLQGTYQIDSSTTSAADFLGVRVNGSTVFDSAPRIRPVASSEGLYAFAAITTLAVGDLIAFALHESGGNTTLETGTHVNILRVAL